MTEKTMAERDAERKPGFYPILTQWISDPSPPTWQVALWDPKSSFFGPGWLLAGVEDDLAENEVVEVDERRIELPVAP